MPKNSKRSSSPSTGGRSDDPAWAHGKPVADSKNSSICIYCDKRLNGGGITRLKYHLAGVKGQAQICQNVPENVRSQMRRLISNLTTHQTPRKRRKPKPDNNSDKYNNNDNNAIVENSGNLITSSSRLKPSGSRRNVGLLTALTTPQSDPIPTTKSALHVDPVSEAQLAIAKWWYDSNVPFSAANSSYFEVMVDAIARVGPGFKPPNFNDLRGPLLKEAAFDIKEHIVDIKKGWGMYGCSIMADGWTNQKPEPIINFFACSPRGTIFLKSVDVSGLNKSREALFEIFDQTVREVGPDIVVQFITDIDAAHKEAGKALQQQYGTFFWSPCAAHCIDLMLETFSNQSFFPLIDETLKKARKVTKFIYNNASILSMMRKEFTKGHDLCRTGITRFATHFLSLHCILKFREEIRQMFSCRKWKESPHASGLVGKEVANIILQDKEFWAQCQHIVEITEPLIRILRLVDSDEKPAIGYIYEAIEKAKEAIKLRLNNNTSAFGRYLRVIETIWEKELYSPLHGAGCFLNPSVYFKNGFGKQSDVNRGLLSTITRLVQSDEVQEKIGIQLEAYKRSTGDFGLPLAIRLRDKISPVAWWEQFGNETPELQSFAMRVLSQCCSATGCERNWSAFEFLHSKKQNHIEYQRLNDLVFVRYNLKLRERFLKKCAPELADPISLDNINLLGEWVCEEPGLLDGDDSDWQTVDGPSAPVKLDFEELPSGGEIVVYDENASFMTTPQRFDTYNINYD